MKRTLMPKMINSYLKNAKASFDKYPAATRYEKGYEAALEDLIEFVELPRRSRDTASSAKTFKASATPPTRGLQTRT